ncbi:patatin-like phospholipase family protein [Streptomyces sp. NRRL B-3648]|uniref:patatin-like phospholipase family protein n=1 Tax=Streptomyces sp. NRRL B-3648 TaxID=1519493 RepID=UPI003B638EAC
MSRRSSTASGVPLPSAVAASTAFPGIYPPITIKGRRYMDGSLQSATNAGLAAGARTLVVIDPQAHGRRGTHSGDHRARPGINTRIRLGPE